MGTNTLSNNCTGVGDIGSGGHPEPATLALLLIGAAGLRLGCQPVDC